MKESYKEDLASNFGLELYADDGNGMGVATTGVYAGKLMSYDSVGNRRSLDAPDSGRFSYVYDAADQLSSVLNPFSELTTFSHDIAGRRTVQRYSNGTRASIIYDTANNVTQFHNRTSTGTAITTNDYKYDNVGNRTGMLEASGDRLTWTYDNGDQLKSERRSGASGYANTFTYDGVGNRTLKNAGATRTTFSYDVADQLVYSQAVAGRTSYVYDNAGNQQIERPPTGSRTTTVWDNENRPTLYRLPDTTLVTMSYNGNNRRVTKQTATETVKFVWDPAADAYLAEFNGSNVLQATYSQEPVQFGRALSQRRSTTSSWYHTDALGSTQALSNSSQVTSDTYLYDAWGNPITSTGTTVNPFRWVGNVGYYFDSDTGLYYIRARTYQPIIARWTSADPLFYMLAKAGALGAFTRDPIGYVGSPNGLYEAFESNALRYADPTGNQARLAQANAAPGFERPVCCRFYGPTLIGGTSNPLPYNAQVTANPGESSWDACQRVAGGYWYTPTVLGVDENGCTGTFHYGNYCGPFRKAYRSDCEAKCPGSPQNVGPDPIDDLDAACFNHDCCVGRFIDWINPVWHRYCNKTFCDKLSSLNCSASPHPFECETYRLRAWLLSCGTLGGFPLP